MTAHPDPLTAFPAPPARPDVPGFTVRSLLGFGSHGEVWLAEDVVSGEAVALKIGKPPDADPPDPDRGRPDPAAASLADDLVAGWWRR